MANARARHDRRTGKFSEDPDKAAKELQACELRRDGLTFWEIGQKLGCSEATASRLYKAVQDRTKAAAEEAAEDVVQTELRRLDRAIAKVSPLLKDPETALRAAEVLEKLSASRRRLLGLDKPARIEHSGPDGAPIPIDARSALVERLAGLAAGVIAGGAASGNPRDP